MKMKMKKKKQNKDNWYTKPRFFDGFTNWILFNPKALTITMIMGHWIAMLLFLTLFIFSLANDWGIVWRVILGLVFGLTLWNLLKHYKFLKHFGSAYENGMSDLLFNGGKEK